MPDTGLRAVVAMAFAALWLHEPMTPQKVLGAGAVLGGVVLTRLGRTAQAVPVEE